MEQPKTMRALVLRAPGAPLQLEEVPCPEPGAGEVLVRVVASPINPSDLAMLQGEYGLGWPYPLIPGLEGSGVVVQGGGGVMARFMVGRNVALVGETQGLWAEYVVVPTGRVLPLPKDLPLGVGASCFVNPLTAMALVQEVLDAGEKSAVSTAAGGALGAMIRRRAAQKGVEIINIVRTEAQVEALKAEGAHHVLNETEAGFEAALAEACKALRCRVAFDAVGGAMTYRLAEALRGGGKILIYGGLSGEPTTLHPGTMIFKGLNVQGFWLSKRLERMAAPKVFLMMREVTKGLQEGFAQTRVARSVPLEEAARAPSDYARDMSGGKILISTGAYPLGL
ncbi:zinc-binding dehydrogenase [Gymnodinialimonas ceratoperidinii]|uniref:Zinc-binding dehydrogenase n=1 Tax=Gymnodinialimonas ceratoperidinii TaxID=2856823 RepID=A0A8F6TXR6_9RHOB|nr:zinc-binding dehydrogenase [Gymnodinialimonas ceratoperidinii]QXT40610.1 zinc-binding dehydrogenase [Gymnodinialimonas ceratoperidinii]